MRAATQWLEADGPPVPDHRRTGAGRKAHLDVVVIQEHAVERDRRPCRPPP